MQSCCQLLPHVSIHSRVSTVILRNQHQLRTTSSSSSSPTTETPQDITAEEHDPSPVLQDPSQDSPLAELLRKHDLLAKSIKRRVALLNTRAKKLRAQQEDKDGTGNKLDLPPRIASSSLAQHHDLASFLQYTEAAELKTTSTVYKGTLYEYTVAEALKAYGFSLNRVGKTNDLGIDLIGHWRLPAAPHELRVFLQCKMTKPGPAFIRELEGAYSGAPAGWEGENVLALLASNQPASLGVQQAVQRSKWPIGVLQTTLDGHVKQLVWNSVASDRGLAGLGVTVKYGDKSLAQSPKAKKLSKDQNGEIIALTWLGEPWSTAGIKAET